MGETYQDLKSFISSLFDVYNGLKTPNLDIRFVLEMHDEKHLSKGQIKEVENYKDSIGTIIEMFSRDKMKVVFFGRYDSKEILI
jgi:hypothetical protein